MKRKLSKLSKRYIRKGSLNGCRALTPTLKGGVKPRRKKR